MSKRWRWQGIISRGFAVQCINGKAGSEKSDRRGGGGSRRAVGFVVEVRGSRQRLLERSQPAHGETAAESVDQALVGGDEIITRGDCHCNIGAVVNGSIEVAGDLERFRQKSPARHSGKVAVEHCFEGALRQCGCDGTTFSRLPEETGNLE